MLPRSGNLKSAELFKESLKTGKTIRELVLEKGDAPARRAGRNIRIEMARIHVEAYGCSASSADSEMISGLIVNGGHTVAESAAESDLSVIVTCSVKDATANRMIHRIKSLSSRPLVVAGCLPKAEPKTVERFAPGASMMGPGSIGRTLQVVESALGGVRIVALEDTDLSKVGLPKVRLNPAVGIIEIRQRVHERVHVLPDQAGQGRPHKLPRRGHSTAGQKRTLPTAARRSG